MSRLFLSEDRIHQLLQDAKENPRDFALLHVAASTALRGCDILRIKLADIMAPDGEVTRLLRIKQKKTAVYVERPLREDCRMAIKAWVDSREDKNPYLFRSLSQNGSGRLLPLTRAAYDQIIKKYLRLQFDNSLLQGCSTHTLRRSVAKLVYKKTKEIAAAQRILGHNSPVNTIKYIDPEEIAETANRTVEELQW